MHLNNNYIYVYLFNYGHVSCSIVLPHRITPTRSVPDSIVKPSYAISGVALGPKPVDIDLTTEEQINVMRKTCHLAREILDAAGQELKASTYFVGFLFKASVTPSPPFTSQIKILPTEITVF